MGIRCKSLYSKSGSEERLFFAWTIAAVRSRRNRKLEPQVDASGKFWMINRDLILVRVAGRSRAGKKKSKMKTWEARNCFRIFFVAIMLWLESAAAQCSSSSGWVGFQADFVMVQHQLRGSFRIVDDCSFIVSHSSVRASHEHN